MVHDPFWKRAFWTLFSPIFGPKTSPFPRILGFSVGQNTSPRARNGLNTLVQRAAQPAHGWGQRWVHRGPQGEKKNTFSKVFHRPLWMLKQVFLARCEPVVARFGQ